MQPVARTVPKTKAVATAAYTELLKGPTEQETGIGLTTSLGEPASGGTIGIGSDGLLSLSSKPLAGVALAQAVYTLTQFPGRQTVVVNGKRYTRNDFEDVTPAILVELAAAVRASRRSAPGSPARRTRSRPRSSTS